MWLQAKQRAAELESIVLWCDGGEGGVSGVAGRGFNDVVQVGSGSFVRTIGIQYPFNDQKTIFARLGDSFLILFWIFVFVLPGQLDLSAASLWTLGIMQRAGGYLWKRTTHVGQNPPNLLD